MDEEFLRKLGLSIARGVPQMATGMVDLAAMPFTMTGLLDEKDVVGGTEYLTQRGLLPPPQEGIIPETLEMLSGSISPSGMGKTLAGGLLGATAFHGSPYLFKQFDPRKIGTGEGAQAYGAGAGYTAESREVAENYAGDISRQKKMQGVLPEMATQTIDGKPINDIYNEISNKADSLPIEQAQIEYEKLNFLEDLNSGQSFENALARIDNESLLPWAKSLQESYKPIGFLYKGDIPDEIIPSFLDWNKRLADQPEVLGLLQGRKSLQEYAGDKGIGNLKGEDVYNFIASEFDAGQAEAYGKASQELTNLGVRGVRYLDQASRKAGKGTSNFVVFQPEDFKIETINDIPLKEYIRKGLLD